MTHPEGGGNLRVGRAEIERMAAAAAVIAECRQALAARRRSILGEITADAGPITEWRHYPDGEIYDPRSSAQFFYHTHPATGRPPREHGHFHTFLRAEGMPAGVAPLVLPELALADATPPPPQAAPLKRGSKDEFSHLVAIALDPRGEPIRLFTTNRWVTGETWYRADDVIRMLDRFTVAEPDPPALVNRWMAAMIRLFRPQIAALLGARDETVMAWRRRRRRNVFEDPRLEITSTLDIDFETQLAFLDRARSEAAASVPPRMPGLPPMAEGWGEGHAG